jgi:peptidoglycan/xylan/chitin deacetylase (PgdA/CDA1 family)
MICPSSMARHLLLAAFFVALAPLACSSEAAPGDVPGFTQPVNSQIPGAAQDAPGLAAGGASATPGSVDPIDGDMTIGGMLQPGASAGGSASNASAAGGSASSDPLAAAGGTGGTAPVIEPGPVVGPVRSELPAPPTNGVPQPAGTPGNLRVLDWAGFSAAISYTFDDSNSSQINNYAALNDLGVPFTFYLQTGKVQESSNPIWTQAVADGHELGNHTQSHQSTGANIGADTDAATQFIESRFGVTVFTMAAPNGSGDYAAIAQSRFLINRGVNDALIRANDDSNPFDLPCFFPVNDAPVDDFNAKVDLVRRNRAWQTMLVHGFNGGTDGAFQSGDLSVFLDAVNYAKSFPDLWIDTLLEVAAYWRAQKALSTVTPAVNGSETTWSWTLPDHFPPGRFLRVTVDGGRLTQGGATIAWDDHGYYEVALDDGSVTLSP